MSSSNISTSNLWRNKDDESRQFVCKECGNKNYKLFMVNNLLWQNKGIGDDTLCKKCFEKKLGRKMTKKDVEQYKHSPINSHIINFKEWFLFVETASIAQSIKQVYSSTDEQKKELLMKTKQQIDDIISLDNLNLEVEENLIKLYKNYFTWQVSQDIINSILEIKNPSDIRSTARQWWAATKDYLVAHKDDNSLKSRLNTISFTLNKLRDESQDWHNEIALKKAKPAREAETFIDLSHLGSKWQGWRWVSLNRKYCELEAASAGHCGNVGGASDDNILSLRDPQNIAHLTFIENNGILGEMKGRSNAKPSPKYHQPIIELLKNDKIKSIKGGGYAPENNFSLNDLPNKEEILQIKPYLKFSNYVTNLSDEEIVQHINDILDANIVIDENGNFVLHQFNNTKEFLEELKKHTNSHVVRNLDLGFLDYFFEEPHLLNIEIDKYDLEQAIENLNKESFERLKQRAEKEEIKLETPEDILHIENEDFKEEILSDIKASLRATYESSILEQYWKDFKSSFEGNEDNDFIIVKINSIDDIRIVLNKKLLKTIISENKNIDELMQDLNFSYYPPDVFPRFNAKEFNDHVVDFI